MCGSGVVWGRDGGVVVCGGCVVWLCVVVVWCGCVWWLCSESDVVEVVMVILLSTVVVCYNCSTFYFKNCKIGFLKHSILSTSTQLYPLAIPHTPG